MKKNLIRSLLLALLLSAAFAVTALAAGAAEPAEEDNYFDAGLQVVREGDTITVTVNDSKVLRDKQPTLAIPCDFTYATVTYRGESGDETVACTLEDGQVFFRVAQGGTYVIQKTDAPEQSQDSGETTPISPESPREPGTSDGEDAPALFTDVKSGSFCYDAVLWAVEKGITNGTGDGTTFSPNASCTRGQAVTFLWRAAGCPAPKSSVNPFTDVKAGSYCCEAVLWAVENGITNGTGDGTIFSPNATCTRGQIVTFLWRAQKSPAAAGANRFTDVAADSYCADAVAWAVENGITNGTGDGTTFSPNAKCTRGQIVTFLYRYMGNK
ncbi:MAG: S-layer homology domain-containing protein [Oscillospiraceae bacterium]